MRGKKRRVPTIQSLKAKAAADQASKKNADLTAEVVLDMQQVGSDTALITRDASHIGSVQP